MKKRLILIIVLVVAAIILAIGIFGLNRFANLYCGIYTEPKNVRSANCAKNAPFFCEAQHMPPSCDKCQDYRACGFKFNPPQHD